MALTTAEKNANADWQAARFGYVSLHTGDPGGNGANEVTGGAPAYARKALTWGAAANGVAAAAAVALDVPSGTTVTHFGFWSAATGGTFRFGGALPAPVTITPQGVINLTTTTPVS